MSSAFWVIIMREFLRFWHQKSRLLSALVRPLVWLFIFGAGFRSALGIAIIPPYQTYITYETYISAGLCAMILLFNGMQSAMVLVYDREMGAMRLLLTAPLPRWSVLFSKLVASACVGVFQVYVFLTIVILYGVSIPWLGLILALPIVFLVGLMLGIIGLVISSFIGQLQNFAAVMNFVIFPMFFLSTALYPLWKLQESSSLLALLARLNPFTYGVELIRFTLYLQPNLTALTVVFATCLSGFFIAWWGYQPKSTLWQKTKL